MAKRTPPSRSGSGRPNDPAALPDAERAALERALAEAQERCRTLEETIRQSDRLAGLGTTLASVAHELNNPLAAVIGFAQLLLKRPWRPEDRAALETISHEALRSARIVRNLLALARPRAQERRLPVSLNEVASHILRIRRYALVTAGITPVLQLDPTLHKVLGQQGQLEQVVLNLLTNAEQALRDEPRATGGARVIVRTRADGADHVALEVEDNGAGVPEELWPRIWDPFWTTKPDGEGAGLGLAVVHGIVIDHGGTVTVDRPPDGGARFIVRLPAVAASADAQMGQASAKPLDVLVVSRQSDADFVVRFLAARGHAVLSTTRPDDAVQRVARTPFDVVICDADLQANDGTPLHERLARDASVVAGRTRLVVAMRAGEARGEADTGMQRLGRPFDLETLRRTVEA